MTETGTPEFWTLHEVIQKSRQLLSQHIWDYICGGSESETTLCRNRHALDSIAFRPRVLQGVRDVSATSQLWGNALRIPVALAPVGSLDSIHSGGRPVVAAAAASFSVPVFFNNTEAADNALMQDIPALKIYQIYPRGDADWIDRHIERAAETGFAAVCITVDTAVNSRRERDLANRYVKPWHVGRKGLGNEAAFCWADVARIRHKHPDTRLILKGIATAADAKLAVEHGVNVVHVSNHGGRQLDHGRGTIDILPEVVDAVAGGAQVFIDGGFCRGTDIVKALILGADLVIIGKLFLHGLAAGGRRGVEQVLELLEAEMRNCMALLGVRSLAGLDRSLLCAAAPVTAPSTFSAFPLLTRPSGMAGLV